LAQNVKRLVEQDNFGHLLINMPLSVCFIDIIIYPDEVLAAIIASKKITGKSINNKKYR